MSAEDAAKALADMHIFAAVEILMESSLVSAMSHTAEGRIRSICRAEQQRCLARYDAAIKAAREGGR